MISKFGKIGYLNTNKGKMKGYSITGIAAFLAALSILSGCNARDNHKSSNPTPEPSSVQTCKTLDLDLSTKYQGGCKDGLADGTGTAAGRDTYVGEFRRGLPHGQGTYTWGADSNWSGESYGGSFYKGNRTGFGILEVSSSSPKFKDLKSKEGISPLNGKIFINGLWVSGVLQASCTDESACFKSNIPSRQEIRDQLKSESRFKQIDNIVLTSSGVRKAVFGKLDNLEECLFQGLIEAVKESKSTSLIYGDELIEIFAASRDKRFMFQIYADCDLRIKSTNEDFLARIEEYEHIGLAELNINIKYLSGEKVLTEGNLVYIDDQFILKNGPGGTSLISISAGNIKKRELAEAASKCSTNIISGCRASVAGRVVKIATNLGIVADRITLN